MALLDQLLSVIAPHVCLVCQREGALVCARCLPDAFLPVPGRCYRCKRLSSDSRTCTACRRTSPLAHVWIRTDYDKTAKQLLYALKFERAVAGASLIGQVATEALPLLPNETIVIPVPTATSRVRQRGYDQAALIAKVVARSTHMGYDHAVRRLSQSRQVGASRTKRLGQLEGAFYVPYPEHIKGRHILLVDDVVTTGATIETVARVLKRAGAKSVDALAFAQKQK